MADPAEQARRAQALDLASSRQQRRLEALRVELGHRRDARDRAQARCDSKRLELEDAESEVRKQRQRMEKLRSSRFSCEAWLESMRMMEMLGEQRNQQASALEKLEADVVAADQQIDETRRELTAAQARLDLLKEKAVEVRAKIAAQEVEAADEEATEDAAARRRNRETASC
jgi:chromosome segregation ATPase